MAKQLIDEAEGAPPQRSSFYDPPADLETLARRLGVKPLDFDELMAMDEVWPEDESVDDFIAAVREWRSEGKVGSLP